MKLCSKRTALAIALASLFTATANAASYPTLFFNKNQINSYTYHIWKTNDVPNLVSTTIVSGMSHNFPENLQYLADHFIWTGSQFYAVYVINIIFDVYANCEIGNVTGQIQNRSFMGKSGEYAGANRMVLVYNQATNRGLNVGKITASIDNSEIRANFAGYMEAGRAATGSTSVYKANVDSVSITAKDSVFGYDLASAVDGAALSGVNISQLKDFGLYIGDSDRKKNSVSLSINSSGSYGSTYGIRNTSSNGTLTAYEGISVAFSSGTQANGADIYGLYSVGDNVALTVNGWDNPAVYVTVENMNTDDASKVPAGSYKVEAVHLAGTGSSKIIEGDVIVGASNSYVNTIRGLYSESAVEIGGNVRLDLSDILTDNATLIAAEAAGEVVRLDSDVVVSYASDNSNLPGGTLIGVLVDEGGSAELGGDVSVSITGTYNSDSGILAILGTAVDSGATSYKGGERTIYFGTDSNTFDASEGFAGVFANFDKMVVASGSTLAISSSTQGKAGAFGDYTLDPNLISSYNGLLYIQSSNELVVEDGGTLSVSGLYSSGLINNSGSISATDAKFSSSTSTSGFENAGTANFTNLVLEGKGTYNNKAGGTITGNTLNLIKDSTLNNYGTISVTTVNLADRNNNKDYDAFLINYEGATLEANRIDAVRGSITNNGTITADYLTTSTATVTNNGTFNILAEHSSSNVTGQFDNYGTLNIGGSNYFTYVSPTSASSSFNNYGSIVMASGSKMKINGNLYNRAGASINSEGTIYVQNGSLENSGEMYVDYLQVSSWGKVSDSAATVTTKTNKTSVSSTSSINLSGNFIVSSSLVNEGTVTVGGTATFDGANIQNSGNIKVGTLQAEGATYTQTGGSLTFADSNSTDSSNWFTNSVIVLSGGTLDSYSLGTGNTYTISNGGIYTVNEVSSNSGSTVVINSGGELQATSLFYNEASASGVITISGGTLTTSADQIFSNVATDSSSYVTSVGDVRSVVQSGVVFDSGCLTITDDYTVSLVSSVTSSLTSAGVSTSKFAINFSGNLESDSNSISVADANDLLGESNAIYLILGTATLDASDSGDTLTVGGDDGDLVSGLGFMNVEGVNAITLKRKGELILMSLNGDDYTSNQLLVDAEDGGSVTIEEEAKLTLGMLGGEATSGWIGSSDNAGTLQVNNGKFLICTLTNSGDIVIADSGTLHTDSLTGTGSVTNSGGLYVTDTLEITGTFINGASAFLEAPTAETTISGTLYNYGDVGFGDVEISGVAINDEYAAWTTMGTVTLNSGGSFSNAGDMSAYGLTVNAGGTFMNSGYFNVTDVEETGAATTVAGTLANTGTLRIDTDLTVDGTVVNDADATLVIAGKSTVSGTIQNSGAVSTADVEVSGAVQNLEGALLVTTNDDGNAALTVTGSGIITNRGAMTADSLEAGAGTVVSNARTGSFTVNGDSTVEGALTNLGNFSVGGELNLTSTGVLTNASESDEDAVMSLGSLTAAEGSSIENGEGGILVLNDTSTIAGTVTNEGIVITSDVSISNAVENTDSAIWFTMTDSTETFAVMTLEEGSSLTNAGTMYADELDVASGVTVTNADGASLTVSGDSSDNVFAGELKNAGEFTVANALSLTETGTIDNTGVLTINTLDAADGSTITNAKDANLVLNAASTMAGTLTNEGNISTADIEISNTASNGSNAAWTTLGTVTVTGALTNDGDLSTDALKVSDGATVTSTNNLTVASTLTVEGGTLDIQSGSVSSTSGVLTGGTITIGSSSAVDAELGTPKDKIGAQIYVEDGSRLSLSTDYGLDWADGVLGSKKGNLIVVSDSVVTDATGYISVGSSSSGSGVAPLAATSDAGLYFGSDSTLVVRDLPRDEQGLFNTQDGTTATIESGAAIFMSGNFDKDATYYILRGYNISMEDDAWGLNTDSEDTVSGKDDAGLKWTFHTVSEDDTVYLQAVEHEDISNLYNIAVPNIANDELDYASTSTTGGFLQTVLYDTDLSVAEKEAIINSAANLAFAGGVMTTALTDATAAFDSVVNHLTMDSDTFSKDGTLWPWDKSGNLWVDVLGSWQHGKHLDATKISGYKYRTQSYGIVLGYDHKLEDRPVVLGGAFSFSDGELKSKGGVNKTKNEYQTYGLSFFGNYSPSPYYNIIGSVHWFHNSADVKQPSSVGKIASQIQTNMLAVGLRGETTIKAGQVNIVPHAEARYIYGKTSKYTTKFDGNDVWNTKSDGTHTVQFPVGVAFRGDIKTESGWNVRPRADLSVIPQVGNTKQKSVVRSSSGVTDAIDGQFLGKFGGSVKVGFQADKGNATVGLRYGFLGGTKGRADHSVMLQGRYRF